MKATHIAASAILLASLASPSAWAWDQDPFGQYFQRKDTVTLQAGDAKAVNAATHVIDPWPRYVGNRNIPVSSDRLSPAVTRYNQGSYRQPAPHFLVLWHRSTFCIEALTEALARYGKPDVLNTDQGSQFTGAAFTSALVGHGIAISMDGKGAWRDNVFVERLWRSVKYEEAYLRAYDSVSEARASIGRYFEFYNQRRPHASLDGSTPEQAYFTPLPLRMAA